MSQGSELERLDEPAGAFREEAAALLRNPLAEDADYAPFEETFADGATPQRGIAGFVLLMRALERASQVPPLAAAEARAERDALIARADVLLADADVAAEFATVYALPASYDVQRAHVHRVGTTSVILECPDRARDDSVALKCVLMRYSSVSAVTTAARRYKERYDFGARASYVPRVYESSDLFVAMEFIHGKTLAETLDEARGALGSRRGELAEITRRRIGYASALAARVARILDLIAQSAQEQPGRPSSHLDLSPSNIILRSDGEFPESVVLVDFGVNYLLTEQVGTSAAITAASDYLAPEFKDRDPATLPPFQRQLADAYSLALITLETATLQNPRTRQETALEVLWRAAPGHARLLEDLLDDRPELRLTLICPDPAGDGVEAGVFAQLERDLRGEAEVQRIFYDLQDTRDAGPDPAAARERTRLARLWTSVPRIWRQWFVDRQAVAGMFRVAAVQGEAIDPAYRRFSGLALGAAICAFMWFLSLLGFVVFTLLFPGPGLGSDPLDTLVDIRRGTYDAPGYEPSEYLPGRIAAIAFGTLAYTAYMNIYVTLDFAGLGRGGGAGLRIRVALARFFVRTLVFIPFVPILWVVWVSPEHWQVLSIPGILWAAFANLFSLAVWREGATRATRVPFSADPDTDNRFDRMFGGWTLGMFAFGVMLGVFAWAVDAGYAKDPWPYALAISVLIVFQVSGGRCLRQGAEVRGRLLRGVFDVRRSLSPRALAVLASGGAAPARERPPGLGEWLGQWRAFLRSRS